MKNHCCKQMEYFLEEGKVLIHYSPQFREYAIQLSAGSLPNNYLSQEGLEDGGDAIFLGALQRIEFCPWCGNRLPLSLSDVWFDELEKLGFENPLEQSILNENFPDDFKSDKWWKVRDY